MIIKCSNCNAALTYDIELGKMKCDHCDSVFDVASIENSASEKDMMECNIFTCTACAAEVAVNNVECSTYCAYCGQPTVVFERVSKRLKPDKIIPFSVTKKTAEKAIRKRLRKGIFVPKELKKFEAERMNGIYVPFWVYDIKYHDSQTLRGKSGKQWYTYHRTATTYFKEVPLDASSNFCNESSQRLEPFKRNSMIDFDESYLSGFYADCYDESDESMKKRVYQKCKDLFDAKTIESVPANDVSITSSKPKREILKKTYALLPVWFMTTRYKGTPYTILVNGQTGKVIGAVPYTKGKPIAIFTLLTGFFLTFVPKLCSMWFESANQDDEPFEAMISRIVSWGFVTLIAYAFGSSSHDQLKKHIKQASDKKMTAFSQKRQEKN